MDKSDEIILKCFGVVIGLFIAFLVLENLFNHAFAVWFFRIGFIAVAAGAVTYGIIYSLQSLTQRGLKIELFRAHIVKKRNESGFAIRDMDSGIVLSYQTGSAQYFTKHRTPKAEIPCDTPPVIPENASVIESLPLLCRCDSVLIAGGKGAGKTNLAFHLAEHQMKSGCEVVVIDPKPQFEAGKWFGARVIGANHNYAEITSFLSDLTGMMKDDRNQVRIWIDELTVLNMRIKRFASLWLPVLIEGREYGKFVSIIGQSKTAGSVGLEGRYDLLDCFDAIAVCHHNKKTDDFFTEIEMAGEGMVIGTAPEKFRMIGYHGNHDAHGDTRHDFRADKGESVGRDTRDSGDRGDDARRADLIGYDPDMRQFPSRIFESRAEKQAVEMYESGKSLSQIATEIFGKKSGERVKRIRAWIEKHA